MSNDDPASDPELVRVLHRLNTTNTEFELKPAKRASDTGAFGETPLHKIATWGDANAARVLLRNGANPNAKGEDDDTPLHRAISQEQPAVVKVLLEAGASLEQRNRFGKSPRDDAISHSNVEVLRLIAEVDPHLEAARLERLIDDAFGTIEGPPPTFAPCDRTPEVALDHLPAFMRICIRSHEDADTFPRTLLASLAESGGINPRWARDLKSLLTPEEKDAIRAFVAYMKQHHGDDLIAIDFASLAAEYR